MIALLPDDSRRFVCGTRAAIKRGTMDYRAVCATCGAGGSVRHDKRTDATRAAVRDSNKPCAACGAH